MLKIATWNVNSLRVRLPQLLQWLESSKPDIVGLQELKLTDDQFPVEEIHAAGYHAVFAGQKTYNGVAILSREPITDVVTAMPGLADEQKRFIAGTVSGVRVINLYVPNGQEVGSEKYAYKLSWLKQLAIVMKDELKAHANLVVMGDFNITPTDADVYDPQAWHEKILCSSAERGALQSLLDLGLTDTFRLFEQAPQTYSWWDYRAAGFRRNLGLRIDLVLASANLVAQCTRSNIDKAPRRWERPSDHAPAVAEFSR